MGSSANFDWPLSASNLFDLDRELTAYHGAGHALGYVDQGRELLSVTIIDTATYRGWAPVVPARVPVQDVAIVAALGPIAEAIHAERTEPNLVATSRTFCLPLCGTAGTATSISPPGVWKTTCG